MRWRVATFALILWISSLLGCVPLSTVQSPEVQKDGSAFGLGIASGGTKEIAGKWEGPQWGSSAWLRFPLASRFDWGLYLGTEGVGGDLKYNIIDTPLLVSGDLSLSLNRFSPMILLGSENLYGGLKYSIQIRTREGDSYWALMLGASVGDRTRIMPQITLGYHSGVINGQAESAPFISLAIGFQNQ